jgi:hypothetical protein
MRLEADEAIPNLPYVIAMRPQAEEAIPNLPFVIARRLKADEAISGGWSGREGAIPTPLHLPD